MNKTISLTIIFLCLIGTFSSAQITIGTTVSHLSPTSESGGIILDISGGIEPYTYNWKKGSSQLGWDSNLVTGIENTGIYKVTVTDANATTAKKSVWLGNIGFFDNQENLDINGSVHSKSPDSPGDYGMATSNNTMENSKWTWFEVEIEDVESEMMVGFVDGVKAISGEGDLKYGFRLLANEGRTLEIIENGVVISSNNTYVIGDRLRIIHNKNSKRMDYQLNRITMTRKNYGTLPPLKVGLFVKGGPGVALNWQTHMDFVKKPIVGNYVRLEKEQDGSFVQVFHDTYLNSSGYYTSSSNAFIRFVYTERYNIVQGENDKAVCVIYNWKKEDVSTGSPTILPLDNEYGTNWKSIDVTHLNPGEFYTLEVTGTNKGEKYYLRFKR